MDALATFITLLRPQTVLSKIVHGGGRWGVRYSAFGQPSFALVLKGPCWLAVDGVPATILGTGDFILFPATPGFTLASDPEVTPRSMDPVPSEHHVDEVVHGDATTEPSVSLLGGYFAFDPINASMLVDLLPRMLHIRATDPAIDSVAPIVELIKRETREKRAGQALVLTRLIEVMLVEALRSASADLHTTGLLAGLRDPQLAAALRGIHTHAANPWTLVTLARQAGMSRSSFAERFARVIGMTPLNYLRQWRIAVAKNMLAREQMSVAETGLAVGYQSASAFSTAFSRETGWSPKQFIGLHQKREQTVSASIDLHKQ
jgi:AraC-like DNA-binding protein